MKKLILLFAVSVLLSACMLPAFADSGGGYGDPAQLAAADSIDAGVCQCVQCDVYTVLGLSQTVMIEKGVTHFSVGAMAAATAETEEQALFGCSSPPSIKGLSTDTGMTGAIRVSPHITMA